MGRGRGGTGSMEVTDIFILIFFLFCLKPTLPSFLARDLSNLALAHTALPCYLSLNLTAHYGCVLTTEH